MASVNTKNVNEKNMSITVTRTEVASPDIVAPRKLAKGYMGEFASVERL